MRRLPLALSIPLVVVLSAGCQTGRTDGVMLTRLNADAAGPALLQWRPDRAVYVSDWRGQHQFLAESTGASDKPIRQWLLVRVLWPIRPAHTGTDPSAINAHVGYLIQTDADGPAARTLYYEGAGNAYLEEPGWWTGPPRLLVRHATLRLTRCDAARSADPLGVVLLEADLPAAVDPDAEPAIGHVRAIIESLSPPGSPGPAQTRPESPPPATTSPGR